MTKTLRKKTAIFATFALGLQSSPLMADDIRIGTNVWIGYEPLHVLVSEPSFDLDEKFVAKRYWNATEVIDAFSNGIVSLAGLTLDEAILTSSLVDDIEVVAILDVSNGADVICGTDGWDKQSDTTVVLEDTALGGYFYSKFANHLRTKSTPVKAKPIFAAVDEHARILEEGQAELFVTFEPFYSELRALGCNEVFTSQKIPNEIIDVLVIRASHFQSDDNREALAKLVDSWFSITENFDETLKGYGARISEGLGVSQEEMMGAYAGIDFPTRKQQIDIYSDGSLGRSIESMVDWLSLHRDLDGDLVKIKANIEYLQ